LRPEDPIDMVALRRYRLRRVRDEMARRSIDACVLVDPVSIRYACGARNMQVFHLRNPARSLVIPAEGPVVLFEFTGCMHLAEGLETVDEIRPSITASYVAAGDGVGDAERAWARQVGEEIRRHCGPAPTVGVERVNAGAAAALAESGFHLVDAQAPLERARSVKSAEEVACIRRSLAATAVGMQAHGCGMTGEYPYLYHEADFDAFGYDGALTENMTICVESYIGEPVGGQGVKLEQQVLLTAAGPELLSTFPYEETLAS
jgi:Xaa-Pro aminopeptidase